MCGIIVQQHQQHQQNGDGGAVDCPKQQQQRPIFEKEKVLSGEIKVAGKFCSQQQQQNATTA